MKDTVVFITGAARGIGAHTARLAAARGAKVALVGLEPYLLADLAADIGDAARWFEADVTDQAALDAAVRGTVDAFGGIDTVVANAGIANRGTIAVGDLEALVRTIDVNLLGTVRTVGATVAAVSARRGYYLLVSSAAAFAALPGMSAYCAAKAGVEHFGNAIRLELAHRGVDVGTAHMSWVDTDLVRDVKDDLPTFRAALDRMPGPFGRSVPVERCAARFVDAIDHRRRRVYVPRFVALASAFRSVANGPLGGWVTRRAAATSVPELEAQLAALGRGYGRNTAPQQR
ncbi:SDR family oxidoreductase [Asanoa sp. NPDC050611]|uniref:SDR family oxidoreductase n=1 Tax=Asanoa sp. NPDC050611 TaxID=3157098 RepID=UPI0033EDDEBA